MRRAAVLVLGALTLTVLLPAHAFPGAPGPWSWLAQGGEDGNPAAWSVDPTVEVQAWRRGLNFPVALQFLDDGRVFYGEWQTGRVNIIAPGNGAISTFVDLDVLTGGEMGLHEVSYREVDGKDYVYVSYVYGRDSYWGCILCRDRLSRFEEVSPGVAGPEQVLLDLPGGFVHNGGIIAWGPLDGKLYYSRGDISYAGLSQEVNGLSGRVMRLNPDGTIPADNPMGPANPTYAYGLRHTFGMDFVPGTQVLVGTENGPERNDEVNLLLAGRNYGWPVVTGFETAPGHEEEYVPPLRAFLATIGPTNGHVYTGTQVPQWTGQFFYGDTNLGRIYRLVPSLNTAGARAPEVVIDTPFLVVDITTGPDGYLYFSRADGIYRVASVADAGLGGVRLPSLP